MISRADPWQCRARSLGDCGGHLTKEHYISGALFAGASVEVRGAPWAPTETVTIPSQGFSRNMLCRKHNNQLSDVDAAGVYALNALEAVDVVIDPRGSWDRFEAPLAGRLWERWCIKTCINIWYERADRSPDKPWQPPSLWVETVFGRLQIEPHAGIYLSPEMPLLSPPGRASVEIQARFPEGSPLPIAAMLRMGNRYFTVVIEGRYKLRGQSYRPARIPSRTVRDREVQIDWSNV